MILFGKRVFTNVTKLIFKIRSHWFRMCPKSKRMFLKETKRIHTHEQSEEGDTNRETEIVVMCLQVKECKDHWQLPETRRETWNGFCTSVM